MGNMLDFVDREIALNGGEPDKLRLSEKPGTLPGWVWRGPATMRVLQGYLDLEEGSSSHTLPVLLSAMVCLIVHILLLFCSSHLPAFILIPLSWHLPRYPSFSRGVTSYRYTLLRQLVCTSPSLVHLCLSSFPFCSSSPLHFNL